MTSSSKRRARIRKVAVRWAHIHTTFLKSAMSLNRVLCLDMLVLPGDLGPGIDDQRPVCYSTCTEASLGEPARVDHDISLNPYAAEFFPTEKSCEVAVVASLLTSLASTSAAALNPDAEIFVPIAQESNGALTFVDMLLAELDRGMQETEVKEKDARKDYEKNVAVSADKRAIGSRSLEEKPAKADAEATLEDAADDAGTGVKAAALVQISLHAQREAPPPPAAASGGASAGLGLLPGAGQVAAPPLSVEQMFAHMMQHSQATLAQLGGLRHDISNEFSRVHEELGHHGAAIGDLLSRVSVLEHHGACPAAAPALTSEDSMEDKGKSVAVDSDLFMELCNEVALHYCLSGDCGKAVARGSAPQSPLGCSHEGQGSSAASSKSGVAQRCRLPDPLFDVPVQAGRGGRGRRSQVSKRAHHIRLEQWWGSLDRGTRIRVWEQRLGRSLDLVLDKVPQDLMDIHLTYGANMDENDLVLLFGDVLFDTVRPVL